MRNARIVKAVRAFSHFVCCDPEQQRARSAADHFSLGDVPKFSCERAIYATSRDKFGIARDLRDAARG